MPRKWTPRVAVKTDEGIEVHCHSVDGNYDTLCGLDGNDYRVGTHGIVPVAVNTKINCKMCKAIWNTAMLYRPSDFK